MHISPDKWEDGNGNEGEKREREEEGGGGEQPVLNPHFDPNEGLNICF
jgi:hypothetical protein